MPKTQADHQTWSLDASSAAVGRAWRVLAVLSALLGFASISTDFYLPAVPAMATALHASHGMLEFSITGYLIGFSIGQLFWGPVSDKFGRRLPADAGQFYAGAGGFFSLGCLRTSPAPPLRISPTTSFPPSIVAGSLAPASWGSWRPTCSMLAW